MEALADLAVGQAGAEQDEDLPLAVARGRGRAAGAAAVEVERLAAEDRGADLVDDLLGGDPGGQEADRAEAGGRGARRGAAARAEQDLDARMGLADHRRDRAREGPGLGDVEDRHVGAVAAGERHRFLAAGGEQAAFDPGLLLEQRREADPRGRVGVDHDRAHRGVRQRVVVDVGARGEPARRARREAASAQAVGSRFGGRHQPRRLRRSAV